MKADRFAPAGGWLKPLELDPLPALLSIQDPALNYFVRRDLLEERLDSIQTLWDLPEPGKIIDRQERDGSWKYRGSGAKKKSPFNYHLLETFRQLGFLVEQFGMDRSHPAIQDAAEYVFTCQSKEGDLRGILGNQYMPYYHGMILAQLIQAGYPADHRVRKSLEWLGRVRQEDGGWVVPVQLIPAREKREAWEGTPIHPDRSRPSSHLATGMALRAFAVHPSYSRSQAALEAAGWLKARFFKPDRYNDRKATAYWTKFQHPFWWPNLLTALDCLARMGFSWQDEDIHSGLSWFETHQEEDGLWPTGYSKGHKTEKVRAWVGLSVCRVFKHYYMQHAHSSGMMG